MIKVLILLLLISTVAWATKKDLEEVDQDEGLFDNLRCHLKKCAVGTKCGRVDGHLTCIPLNPKQLSSFHLSPRNKKEEDYCGIMACPPLSTCVIFEGLATCIPNLPPRPPLPPIAPPPNDCESVTDLNQCPSPRCQLVRAISCCNQTRVLCVTVHAITPLIEHDQEVCDRRHSVCMQEITTRKIFEIPANCRPAYGFEEYKPINYTCRDLACESRGMICGYGQTTECLGTKCCPYTPVCVPRNAIYPPFPPPPLQPPPPHHPECPISNEQLANLRSSCYYLNCTGQRLDCFAFFDDDCNAGRCCGPYVRCEKRSEFPYPHQTKILLSPLLPPVNRTCGVNRDPWSCHLARGCKWETYEGCCGYDKAECVDIEEECRPSAPEAKCYVDIRTSLAYESRSQCTKQPPFFVPFRPFRGSCESLNCRSIGYQCVIVKLAACIGTSCCQPAPLCVPPIVPTCGGQVCPPGFQCYRWGGYEQCALPGIFPPPPPPPPRPTNECDRTPCPVGMYCATVNGKAQCLAYPRPNPLPF